MLTYSQARANQISNEKPQLCSTCRNKFNSWLQEPLYSQQALYLLALTQLEVMGGHT